MPKNAANGKNTSHNDVVAVVAVTLLLLSLIAVLCYLELTGQLYFSTEVG